MTDDLKADRDFYEECAKEAHYVAAFGSKSDAGSPQHLGENLHFDQLVGGSTEITGIDGSRAALIVGRIVGGWTGGAFAAPTSARWARRTCDVGTLFASAYPETLADAVIIEFPGVVGAPALEPSPPKAPQEIIHWLHAESGLTWDQLGRILGVSRRSLHAWANGQRVSGTNLERLSRVYATISGIDADSSDARRHALFNHHPGASRNLFDELVIRARKAVVPRDEYELLRRLGMAPEG